MQALGSVLTTCTIPSALPHAMPHLHVLGIVWPASKRTFLLIQIMGHGAVVWVLTAQTTQKYIQKTYRVARVNTEIESRSIFLDPHFSASSRIFKSETLKIHNFTHFRQPTRLYY